MHEQTEGGVTRETCNPTELYPSPGALATVPSETAKDLSTRVPCCQESPGALGDCAVRDHHLKHRVFRVKRQRVHREVKVVVHCPARGSSVVESAPHSRGRCCGRVNGSWQRCGAEGGWQGELEVVVAVARCREERETRAGMPDRQEQVACRRFDRASSAAPRVPMRSKDDALVVNVIVVSVREAVLGVEHDMESPVVSIDMPSPVRTCISDRRTCA